MDACLDRVGPANLCNTVCDAGALDDNGRPMGNPDAAAAIATFWGPPARLQTTLPAPLGGNPDAGDNPTGAGAVQDRRSGAAP